MSIIICYAIIYILEACIFSQYCQNLFSSKIQAKYKTFFFFFSYLFLFVASLLDCYLLNLFLFLIVNLLCMVIIYHLKFLTALFHSLFVTISMLLSEICIMGILSYFGSELYGKRAYFRNLIILSVISKLLYFLILQFTSFYLKQRIKKEIIFKKNTIFLNIIPLLSAFIARYHRPSMAGIPRTEGYSTILGSVLPVLHDGYRHCALPESDTEPAA